MRAAVGVVLQHHAYIYLPGDAVVKATTIVKREIGWEAPAYPESQEFLSER